MLDLYKIAAISDWEIQGQPNVEIIISSLYNKVGFQNSPKIPKRGKTLLKFGVETIIYWL